MTFETIRDDFALIDDWEDRYRYVIELGRKLPALADELKTDGTKVRGCASQVWLVSRFSDGRLALEGDSDAHIVRGLVAILIALYQGKSAAEVLATDAEAAFAALGLKEHLTPQRSNGFASMVARVRADAAAAAG
ncbi:MAG: SufE family protein [Hyphomicrobiaceae bacterium]|nr:SufE family protein [Hyphomicrobiaceae bacterium]